MSPRSRSSFILGLRRRRPGRAATATATATAIGRRIAAAGGRRSLRRFAIVACLLVAACWCAAACSGRAPAPEQGERYSADVGCEPRMQAALQGWADRGLALSIVDVGGDRSCVAAFGPADPETGRPNTTDTVFAIGSVTKPVTAAAIFDLIDAGVLTLDDPAGLHLPDLTGPAAAVSIRDLLLHTGGLAGEHGFDHVPLGRDDAIHSISGLEQITPPGREYRYENTNYTILALIIEAVTERGYRRYVVDEILLDRSGLPLGGGWWDGEPAPVGDRAWGHIGARAAPQRGRAPGPHWAMEGNGLMAMTPLQLAEWTFALFNERILSPEATRRMLSTTTRLAGPYLELPGWAEIDRREFGVPFFHTAGGGSGIGHEVNVMWFPEQSRTVVVARNGIDHDVRSFEDDVLPALIAGTGVPEPRPVADADPAVLDAVAGDHRIGENGELSVTVNDGGIVVTARGADALLALFPIPDGREDDATRTTDAAADLLAGAHTPTSLRKLHHLTATYGPVDRTTSEVTFFDGDPAVLASLHFADTSIAAILHTDLAGVTHFEPLINPVVHPYEVHRFFTWAEGGFVEQQPDDRNVPITIRPAEGGIEIVTPSSTTLTVSRP